MSKWSMKGAHSTMFSGALRVGRACQILSIAVWGKDGRALSYSSFVPFPNPFWAMSCTVDASCFSLVAMLASCGGGEVE